MKFWLSYSVPQRHWVLENAKLHGAEIVPLEKQADVLLVDHARKNQPPGTHSFRFIERSIRAGALANLDDHAVGPASRVQRPVGSRMTAPKKARTPFTDADDQLLWDHVAPCMRAGGNWKGNEIYKQLEQLNARHTFQSWRDRFLKHVVHQRRRLPDQEAVSDARTPAVVFSPAELGAFSAKDASMLYVAARDILACSPADREVPWANFARTTSHSVHDWKALFNDVILPKYHSRARSNTAEEEAEEAEEANDKEAEEAEEANDKEAEEADDEEAEEADDEEAEEADDEEADDEEDAEEEDDGEDDGEDDDEEGTEEADEEGTEEADEEGTEEAGEDAGEEEALKTCVKCLTTHSHQCPNSLPRPEPVSPYVRRVGQFESQHTAGSPTPTVDSDPFSPIERPQTPPTLLGKRKRVHQDSNIEIPPTPDQEQHAATILQPPSPPPLQSPQLPHRASPPFIREREKGGGQQDSPQPTSPLMVSLVSDAISSFSSGSPTEASSDVDSASLYHFDTAPDQPANWDTAPDDGSPDFETAPTRRREDGAPLRTQPPVPAIDLANADFDLPPPDGGWDSLDDDDDDELEEPVLASDHRSPSADPAPDEATQDEDEYASWKAKHQAAYSGLNQDDVDTILHVAIVATSFNFDTADRVVKVMVEMYRAGKSAGHVVVVPDNIPGCWTMEDDDCLRSDHTGYLKRVRRKHGIASCEERITFLHDYNQE
ncbi:hypothetical protein DV737_g5533, partial [Chaetothyriales sp. CBS 132003]